MTKKDLLELLSDFNDNDIVVVEVFDTILYEDLYDFSIDEIELGDGRTEVRLCPIQKTTTEMKKRPSCLNWDYSDFVAAYTDVCVSLNIVPKALTVDEAREHLERFFDLHNEWIVETINNALRDWIYEKLLNEKQDQ